MNKLVRMKAFSLSLSLSLPAVVVKVEADHSFPWAAEAIIILYITIIRAS